MKPETVKKLQENIAELRELITFLATEAAKLNDISSINVPTAELAAEVLARKRAYETISTMLAPLFGKVEGVSGINPREYSVDVEDMKK